MDGEAAADGLQARLRRHADAAYAAGAKAYLKSDLAFIGARTPRVRAEAAAFLRSHADLDRPGFRRLVDGLWTRRVFELRLLATVLLQRRAALLGPRDLSWLEGLLRDCRGWALMDNLAPYAVAHVLAHDPALRQRTLTRWAKDNDFWMRRAALLTMHRDLGRGEGDWALWQRIAVTQLEDQPRWGAAKPTAKERFFIRKALGWVLRDRSHVRPQDTVAFVRAHRARLSGLTLREATRRLPAAERAALDG